MPVEPTTASLPGEFSPPQGPTRRTFLTLSAAAAGALTSGLFTTSTFALAQSAECINIPEGPTAKRPDPQPNPRVFSDKETQLAFRNHGHLAEFLDQPITPLGMHYLLVHFDVPNLSANGYEIAIGGRVRTPRRISLTDIKARPQVTEPVIMECAGTGRSTFQPRGIYVPWFKEAIGNYEWTGTPLRSLLEESGLLDDAVEVLFTGWDTGVDLGVEHAFERSLPIKEALRDGVMLAWAQNGQPLLPQHGFPLRLIVPTWYGMTSVKWLRAITVLNQPFKGIEQAKVYRYQKSATDPGVPVTVKRVHSAMKPPGLADAISRYRFAALGRHVLQGMAWSGTGAIRRVEVSTDGGGTWRDAEVGKPGGPYSWTPWSTEWQVSEPGEYVLSSRATDTAGNIQPLSSAGIWNRQGMGGNVIGRIHVIVQAGVGQSGEQVPSRPRQAVSGADVPLPLNVVNQVK